MAAERRAVDRGQVEIDGELCKGCALCVSACPVGVLHMTGTLNRRGSLAAECDGAGCTGCGICFYVCPEPGAITVRILSLEESSCAP